MQLLIYNRMKKRILLVNKFYYNRGGAEVVAINLENELKSRDYCVAVFAMDYKDNIKTQNIYCASTVNFNGGVAEKMKFALRTLGYGDIVQSFKDALNSFKPDIVHFHNVHSYLSPIVVKLAKDYGCKVVWTLHDYKLICPSYSCLNHGKVCEKCFKNKFHLLRYRCMKNSFMASVLAFLEAEKWNKNVVEKYTDTFICPSDFIATQMIKAGLNSAKIKVICNFVDPLKSAQFLSDTNTEKDDFYAYIGRLSHEKGVDTLLSVASKLPYKLKIAGSGPLSEEFRSRYSNSDNIEFLGHLNAQEIGTLLKKVKAIVVPSEWYENNPLSVIEALCAGTPVIGANIGGISELITDYNGFLFTSGNKAELSECIKKVMTDKEFDYSEIKKKAYDNFSADKHFEKLEKIYN